MALEDFTAPAVEPVVQPGAAALSTGTAADSVYATYESRERAREEAERRTLTALSLSDPVSGIEASRQTDFGTYDPDPTGYHTKREGEKLGTGWGSDYVKEMVVAGRLMSHDELKSTPDGMKLLAAATRARKGQKRGFIDAITDFQATDLPFISLFATVGGSISDAVTVSNALEKLQNGEEITPEERTKVGLYMMENKERSESTWGGTVGDIVRAAPGFMFEFLGSNAALGLARRKLVTGLAQETTEAAAKSLSHYGITRATKILADESADDAVGALVKTFANETIQDSTAAGLARAASSVASNQALRRDTVKAVADVIERSILNPELAQVTGAAEWAPGVARKVAEARAEQAVATALAKRTATSATGKALRALGAAAKDGLSRGLLDVGTWGTESASVLFTDTSSAGKAALDALSTFFFEAPLKGAELMLANKAVTLPLSAALGGTVGRQELAIRQAALQNDDPELMARAHAIGLGLDMLEYVSENTGRGLTSLARAGALRFAPRLAAPAARTAGQTRIASAALQRNPATGAVTGAEFSGLIEQGRGAEVGGVINRFIRRTLGDPETSGANVLEDQVTAVRAALERTNVRVPATSAALVEIVRSGQLQPGLAREVAEAIGPDVKAFTKRALRDAYAERAEGMKMRSFAQYWAADFMARKHIGPATAERLFEQMGYNGVVGEMFEERYSDVVSALFGWDAEKDQSFKARFARAFEAVNPGWKQLTAEAVGFAVPMVAKAGTMRALRAIGGGNRYTEYRDTAALFLDSTRHGSVGQWRYGDYLVGHRRALEAERQRLAGAESRRAEAMRTRPSGADEQWDRANLAPIDEEIRRYRTAAERMEDYHRTFLESVAPEVRQSADAEVSVPNADGTRSQMRLSDHLFSHRQSLDAAQARLSAAEESGDSAAADSARREIERLENAHESVMASLPEDVRSRIDTALDVAPLSQAEAEGSEEEYNRKVVATAMHAAMARSAAARLVDSAARMGQTLDMFENRQKDETKEGFRRIAHWAVKVAGALVSGDAGLLSVNPAQWNGADVGLPEGIQEALKLGYHRIFAEELRTEQQARSAEPGAESIHEASFDAAHARALEKFQPVARRLMAETLAAHQARMFSQEEILDIAAMDVARSQDLAFDETTREFVSPQGRRVTFSEFLDSNRKEVERLRDRAAVALFDTLVGGSIDTGRVMFSRTREDANPIVDVINIPADLPTAEQAVVSMLARNLPGMRNVLRAREIDPDKPIEDQLGSLGTRQAWLDALAASVLPSGETVTGDAIRTALERADRADPVLLEAIARDLGFTHDGTDAGVAARNRQIVELAVLARASQDPNVRTYSRAGQYDPSDWASTPWSQFTTARRRVDGQWEYVDAEGRLATAETVEDLDARMAESGEWAPASPRVIFTSAQLLQASDPMTMLQSLHLLKRYKREMANSDPGHLDPLARTNEDGTPMFTREQAEQRRETEKRLAAQFDENHHQLRPQLYLLPGESATDAEAMTRAEARMNECRDAWYARNAEDGYVTVAHNILRRVGVSIPLESNGMSVGMVNADLRGKYTLSVNAFRSHRRSGDIFVPINHETAQNYKAALLNATLFDGYFRNRRLIANIFASGLQDFMKAVDRALVAAEETARAQDDLELAKNIANLRAATTLTAAEQTRRPTASTWALFVSAFALFQTEQQGNAKSVLGDYAPALKAVAQTVRSLPQFQSFMAVVDRVYGGTGFNPALIRAAGGLTSARGLARLYALYAPESTPSLEEAIRNAQPGGLSAEEFMLRVHTAGNAALRAGVQQAAEERRRVQRRQYAQRQATAQQGTQQAPVQETPASPLATVAAVQEAVAQAGDTVTENDVLESVGGAVEQQAPAPAAPVAPADPVADLHDRMTSVNARLAEVRASMDAGEADEAVLDEYRRLCDERAAISRALDAVTAQNDDPFLDEALGARDTFEDDGGDPELDPVEDDLMFSIEEMSPMQPAPAEEAKPKQQRTELQESEIRGLVPVLARIGRLVGGGNLDPNATDMEVLLRRFVPGIRKADVEAVVRTYLAMDAKARQDEFEDLWTLPDETADDEGAGVDGGESFNDRSVQALRSKALGNMLAFAQLVNPHTGRNLQGFIEDLRATVRTALEGGIGEMSGTVKGALEFVDRLVNPRADRSASATVRDAKYVELLDRFVSEDNAPVVAQFIDALLGRNGPAVNRKAAYLLGYLAAMPANIRRQMTMLISSSAPSQPTRLRTYVRRDEGHVGEVTFLMEKRTGNASALSTQAIAGMYQTLAGKTAAQIREVASAFLADAKAAVEEGGFDSKLGLFRRGGRPSLFATLAKIVGKHFGYDCPLASILSSGSVAVNISQNAATHKFVRDAFTMIERKSGVPYICETFAYGLNLMADYAGKGEATPQMADAAAVLTFTAGSATPGAGHMQPLARTSSTSRRADQIAVIFRAYEETMPQTIMTAEIDPTRTSKAASSIAATLRGVEPAVQVFMDRRDDSGFRKIAERYFSKFAELSDEEKEKALGVCRQSMCWPTAARQSIIAKCISKSAFSGEIFMGCRTSYDMMRDLAPVEGESAAQAAERRAAAMAKYGPLAVERFRDDNTFYVPVYSGDKSSAIILAVPRAKEFRAEGKSYEDAAREVSSWIGLDLLGVDAKRAAVSSLEAPGVGFIGLKYDENGEPLADEDGTPQTGECRVNIVWSADGGKNESMLGTTLATGYGVEQLKRCAKDPRSATLKFHLMNVGDTGKYGTHLSLLKSLDVAPGEESGVDGTGDFAQHHPARVLMDFIRKQRSSDSWDSTSVVTDFDSIKLALANSKMMGVRDGSKVKPLMEYVFGRLKDHLDRGEKLADSYEGDELDALVGDIDWVDLAVPARSNAHMKMSDLLDGVRIDAVKGLSGAAFSLSYRDNDLMGFSVANVSHTSKTPGEYGQTARNYMVDATTTAAYMERGWHADAGRATPVFTNLSGTLSAVQDLVAAWGLVATDMVGRPESVASALRDSEDAQDAARRGEPANGRFMRDILAKALSTEVKKRLNIPVHGIDAPLVSNMSWIENGQVKTHGTSQMFRDTLRGSLTIPASERAFYRGHRRMAICNVNCTDASFRYGMYLDEAKFAQTYGCGTSRREIVEALDRAFTEIRDVEARLLEEEAALASRTKEARKADPGAYVDWSEALTLRKNLMSCFMDHHGNDLGLRVRRYNLTTTAEDGTKRTVAAESPWYAEVSFEDLFTDLVRTGGGKPTFDRTAVYFDMHLDRDGEGAPGRIYLGGTMFGLPRTPSYNGSMWLQTVRAGLPVTESGEENAWTAGRDAMVAPDPYTLQILGCDHDGDKSKLYMLHAEAPTAAANGKAARDRHAAAKYLDPKTLFTPEGRASLMERRKDYKTKTLHEWQLKPTAAMQANNTFVRALFDMSRAQPVMDSSEAETPFFTGDVIGDGTNHGAAAVATKASLVYKDLWEQAITKNPGVIAKPLLDAASGRTVGDPKTAARVGDGAQNAADARAVAVSLAKALHYAWASGLFDSTLFRFGAGAEGSKRWLDFMHHIDGLSNMTFDDIKEQVCSRLGVTAGMMETIIADIMNHGLTTAGRAPVSDKEFVDAFVAYAKEVNGKGPRMWMNRAANKGDFVMQRFLDGILEAAGGAAAYYGLRYDFDSRHYVLDPAASGQGADFVRAIRSSVQDYERRTGRTDGSLVADRLIDSLVRESRTAHSVFNAYALYCATQGRGADGMLLWYGTISALKAARRFTAGVNYTDADPASLNAFSELTQREDYLKGLSKETVASLTPEKARRYAMMNEAATAAYRLSSARTMQAYAAQCIEEFDESSTDFAETAAQSGGPASVLAAKLLAAQRLQRGDRLQGEANAQMVGNAIAAFRTVKGVKGSAISSANALDVMRAFATGSAESVRGAKRRNAPLDMRRGLEDMFELMYRMVSATTARSELPVFAYFSERGDSGARGYSSTRYYGDSDVVQPFGQKRDPGLGRITLAFQGVTEGQMDELRALWTRTVEGRELDSDGTVAKGAKNVMSGEAVNYGFAISEETLAAFEQSAEFRTSGREMAQIKKLIAEARSVLKALEPVLGKNPKIEPSAMFGQLLPLYASLTMRLDRVPDSRSTSIVAAMPGVYEAWASELARLDADYATAGVLRLATAVNFAPPVLSEEKGGKVRIDEGAMAVEVAKLAKELQVSGLEALLSVPKGREALRRRLHPGTWSQSNPEGKYNIDIFGNNGLFGSIIEYVKSPVRIDERTAATSEDEAEAEAVPALPVEPAPVMEEASPSAPAKDPYVQDLATRVGGLFRMWNGAQVVYEGGDSFILKARLGGSAALHRNRDGVETQIRIRVVPQLMSDEEMLAIWDKKSWRESHANRRGIPVEEMNRILDALKTPEERLAYLRETGTRPVGVTKSDTDWAVSARELGVLSREIELERQDRHPNVVYHECFHAALGFLRDVGTFSMEDVKALQRRYGKSSVRENWFNEEKAAEDFKRFVEDNVAKDEATRGIFQRILDLVKALYHALIDGGFSSDAYDAEMAESPLAAMILTGTAELSRSAETDELDSLMDEALTDPDAGPLRASQTASEPETADAAEQYARVIRDAVRPGETVFTSEIARRTGLDVRDVWYTLYTAWSLDGALPLSTWRENKGIVNERDPEDVSVTRPTGDEAMYAVEDELNRVFPERMNAPYSSFDTLARSIGMAIRSGMREAGLDAESAAVLRTYANSWGNRRLRGAERAVAEEAVRRVAATYGIEYRPGTTELDNAVFSALVDVNSMIRDARGVDGRVPGPIVHGEGQRGGASETRDPAFVTAADMSSAILVACGTRPSDLAWACARDIRRMRERYRGSDFEQVLDRHSQIMDRIAEADPTMLCDDADAREELLGGAIREVKNGLVEMDPDATGLVKYRLADAGTSNAPFFEENLALYANHVDRNGDGNPDFQAVTRRTLDTLYTILAGMRYWRAMGFEPGDAETETRLDESVPPPVSVMDTAGYLGIEARQLLDREFEAVDFFDQPAFVSNNIESWLESTVTKTFGQVPVGEHMRAMNNRHAKLVHKISDAENWLAACMGMNVLPGQRLHAVETVQGRFAMEHGSVVRRDGGVYRRFELYKGRRTDVSFTEDEARMVDMVLKADKVWANGGRKVVTGVNEIRFSVDDPADESYYSRVLVETRFLSGREYSDFDRALYRIDRQLPRFIGDGLRERFVQAACRALREAKASPATRESTTMTTDYVLGELEKAGVLVAHETRVPGRDQKVLDQGVLVLDVDDIERMFRGSTAYAKLKSAGRDFSVDVRGRQVHVLDREARVAPLMDAYREACEFVRQNPWLTDGDGRFFNSFRTPLPFVRGSGVFMYNAVRRARETVKSLAEKMSAEEATFREMMSIPALGEKTLDDTSDAQIRLLGAVYGLRDADPEVLRRRIRNNEYARGTERSRRSGLVLDGSASLLDVAKAIYDRLVEAAWRDMGDPVVERVGDRSSVARMIDMYEESRERDGALAGATGVTDEMMFRTSAVLPANAQLGHAIHNVVEGVTNALAFRSTLVNMLMTPDAEGEPTCYADPSAVAAEASGVPDAVWGTIARWWARANTLQYDETKTGVENAHRIYKLVHDQFTANGGSVNGKGFGELKGEEMDCKSITGFLAQKDDKGAVLNKLGGGYALGYARHLLQSSRTLGSTAQRAVIHRSLAWSKALSVSFSFFFPLATKWESPTGAVGAIATLGSNRAPDWLREHHELASSIQKLFGGKGWITNDFLGFRDIVRMMDSNDPFLAELKGWAHTLGVSLSDSRINPLEPQRSVLQKDVRALVEMTRDKFGATTAARLDSILRTVLLRGGDKAFTYALNATKLATVAQIYMKLRQEAQAQGRAFDPVRDLKRYVGYINAEIGGIDPLRYAWAHPMNRGLMSMLMFSWEWTRGAWEAGGGGALEDFVLGGHNVTAEERKYIVGRWVRMFGAVMIGVPMMMQLLIKFAAIALGHDDDDDKWWTFQNEDKAKWTAFDLTPLMRAVAERFPAVAQWKAAHPALGAAIPMYTGTDRANRAHGNLWFNPATGKWETNGRRYYMHFGKQGWEFLRWFTDWTGQLFSKLSMPLQRMLEGSFGRSLSWLDRELPWAKQGPVERWLNPSLDSATANMVKAFLPFTLTGFTDKGDAGFLSAFGPIQMGASDSATQDRLKAILKSYAFNDRRGYAPTRLPRTKAGKFRVDMAARDADVNRLVRIAKLNGATEKQALKLIDSALGDLTATMYNDLLEALPQRVDGDFDAARVAKICRAMSRLGRTRKNMVSALEGRMEKRKAQLPPDLRALWSDLIRQGLEDGYANPKRRKDY